MCCWEKERERGTARQEFAFFSPFFFLSSHALCSVNLFPLDPLTFLFSWITFRIWSAKHHTLWAICCVCWLFVWKICPLCFFANVPHSLSLMCEIMFLFFFYDSSSSWVLRWRKAEESLLLVFKMHTHTHTFCQQLPIKESCCDGCAAAAAAQSLTEKLCLSEFLPLPYFWVNVSEPIRLPSSCSKTARQF